MSAFNIVYYSNNDRQAVNSQNEAAFIQNNTHVGLRCFVRSTAYHKVVLLEACNTITSSE